MGNIVLTISREITFRRLSLIIVGLLPFVAVALVGCDDDTVSSKTNLDVINFPNAVGSQWTYFVHDSLLEAGDTVDVHITGLATLPGGGGQAKIWTCTYRNWTNETGGERIDTEYVQIIGDTIRIHRPRAPEQVTILKTWWLGRTWTSGEGHIDTTTLVAENKQINTPFGWFTNALQIERKWSAFEVGNESSTLYFVDDVGLVFKHYRTYLLPEEDSLNANEVWGILDYNDGR